MVYESNFRFHDPVRYFTANDPYYWEIDNIPLKQLMENDLWLKDQLEAGIKVTIDEIDRSGFSELKPYSEEVDNIVKVKPGRFTARINDPMVDRRLHDISRIAGEVFDEDHAWRVATLASSGINLGTLTSGLTTQNIADDATYMNGLYERAFTAETVSTYLPPQPMDAANTRTVIPANTELAIPGLDGMFIIKDPEGVAAAYRFATSANEGNYVKYVDRFSTAVTRGFIHSGKAIEQTLIKFWRGVTRTAVVDIPNELSLEIPSFNLNDFNYIDTDGTVNQRLDAEIRIDLLFIYSKPVDAPSTKIRSNLGSEFSRTITRAELGLVKGAGVILDKTARAYGKVNEAIADDLGTKIFANVNDSLSTSGGFEREGIYGSFPVPDDLMNLTPLLMENLEEGHPLLIGQSILPIAYVVVRKPEGASTQAVVTNNDIIDIRPFFRTTELSYNERAGIAAASPQISFANPVVGRLELKDNLRKVKQYIDDALPTPGNSGGGGGGGTPSARTSVAEVIGTGYILGGLNYGPEAAIIDFERRYRGRSPASLAESQQILVDDYGYPQYLVDNNMLDNTPGWDKAFWAAAAVGQPVEANDFIDILYTDANPNQLNGQQKPNYIDIGSKGVGKSTRVNTRGPNGENNMWTGASWVAMTCRKRINFDNLDASAFDDYYVEVDTVNCSLMINVANANDWISMNNIVVTKEGPSSFVIQCFWSPYMMNYNNNPAMTLNDLTQAYGKTGDARYSRIRTDPLLTAGTWVCPASFATQTSTGTASLAGAPTTVQGIATLPSVHFRVIGIRSDLESNLKTYDTIATPLRLS